MTPTISAIVGRGDLEDQRWLDGRILAIEDGIEAVTDIARNWTDLRNLSRLHPGVSAQDYILARVGHPLGRGVIVPLLAESNWSNRQIAAVAGVGTRTVDRIATAPFGAVPRPAETLGADGKLRPARVVRTVAGGRDEEAQDKWQPSLALMSSESAEWYTPRHIVAAVVAALGAIDLDPCADPERTIPAGAHFTEQDDGLAHPWYGRIYMNPPYGRPIGAWTERLAAEYRAGHVTAAVALVPARTETDWWATLDAEFICLVHGRLAFSGHETSAPFPSAAIYLGCDGEQFARAFDAIGEVYRRVRL